MNSKTKGSEQRGRDHSESYRESSPDQHNRGHPRDPASNPTSLHFPDECSDAQSCQLAFMDPVSSTRG